MRNKMIWLLVLLLCAMLQQADAKGNEDYFEATQSATSALVKVARQKALLHARNLLATMIDGKIVNVSKSYIDHHSLTGVSADEFVTETRAMARVVLEGAEIADESVVQEKKGDMKNYTVTITLRLSQKDVFESLCERLKTDSLTLPGFDQKKFEEEWNKQKK